MFPSCWPRAGARSGPRSSRICTSSARRRAAHAAHQQRPGFLRAETVKAVSFPTVRPAEVVRGAVETFRPHLERTDSSSTRTARRPLPVRATRTRCRSAGETCVQRRKICRRAERNHAGGGAGRPSCHGREPPNARPPPDGRPRGGAVLDRGTGCARERGKDLREIFTDMTRWQRIQARGWG